MMTPHAVCNIIQHQPLFLSILFYSLHILSVFLLCQILSATWTSPSLTWNWTVFLTCPTSPPSGTQWRCSSRPAPERSRRKSLRAQCYDATEFPPAGWLNETQRYCCTVPLQNPHTRSLTFHLSSWITSATLWISSPHLYSIQRGRLVENNKKYGEKKSPYSQKSHEVFATMLSGDFWSDTQFDILCWLETCLFLI